MHTDCVPQNILESERFLINIFCLEVGEHNMKVFMFHLHTVAAFYILPYKDFSSLSVIS